MVDKADNWERIEFCSVDFGDKRLDERFTLTVEKLSQQPMSHINSACQAWSDTKAAYRLFNNAKVTAEKILLPHQNCTIERIKAEKLVLAVQDTTYLNYDKHKAKIGLGSIGKSQNKITQGLVMHNTLAITPGGLSLGFIDQQIYARTRNKNEISNKQLPFEEKESYRWLKAMQAVNMAATGEARVITVGDREADIYELFHYGEENDAEFVIRAAWNRSLNQGRCSTKKYLWDFMKKQPALGSIILDIPTEGEKTRKAFATLRAGKIKLKCPQRKGERLSGVELYAVWLNEPRAPKNEKAVE